MEKTVRHYYYLRPNLDETTRKKFLRSVIDRFRFQTSSTDITVTHLPNSNAYDVKIETSTTNQDTLQLICEYVAGYLDALQQSYDTHH